MSKKQKLLEKARNYPKDFKFQDLETLLQQFGFKQVKTNAGSHFKWINEERGITFMAPRKNPVKVIYIKNLLKILNLHFNYTKNV